MRVAERRRRRRGRAALGGMALLVVVAVVVALIDGGGPGFESASRPSRVSAHRFSYGFDLTNMEPTAPSAGRLPACGASDPQRAALSTLHSFSGSVIDQAIEGFGADADPEPRPGVFDMSGIRRRLSLITRAGGIPVLTLVSAPDWMKDLSISSDSFQLPPTPSHYEAFAQLAAHIAEAFPQVHYFVVWSELRGFYDTGRDVYDYRDYTAMYDDVYRAIKQARPDDEVGGPYVPLTGFVVQRPGIRVPPNGGDDLSGPWGSFSSYMLAALDYWITHRVGADFLAVDGATSVANLDSARLMLPSVAAEQYAAADRWIRERSALPIWWMESHIQPSTGWSVPEAAAARIATLAEMSSSGASVGMQWQPESQKGWADQGLWTSPLRCDGGRPTQLAVELRSALPVLEGRPTLEPGAPPGTVIVSDRAGTLTVNTTDTPRTVRVGGTTRAVGPFGVVVS